MSRSTTRRKKPLVAAAAALLLATPSLLAAQPVGPGGFRCWAGHHCGPGGPGGFGPAGFGHRGPLGGWMMERLGLGEAQQDEVRAVLESYRPQLEASFEQLADARDALRDRIHAETFDEGAIREAAGRIATVETDMALTRGRIFQEINAILTPEQRAQLQELHGAMSTLREFRGPRVHPRPGEPGPWGGPDN